MLLQRDRKLERLQKTIVRLEVRSKKLMEKNRVIEIKTRTLRASPGNGEAQELPKEKETSEACSGEQQVAFRV